MDNRLDNKGNEIFIGDYLYLSHPKNFHSYHGDNHVVKHLVAIVELGPGDGGSTLCIGYPHGWPFPEGSIGKGWWVYEPKVCIKIPRNLIEKGDKKLIASFIRLEGFEIEEENIFIPD